VDPGQSGDKTAARWEHFPHRADIGIRGCGPTREAAFEQAAIALTAICTDPRRVAERTAVEVACDGDDLEILFYDYVNALVYEMATRHMLFARCEVGIDGVGLRARAHGEPVDVRRHEPAVEPKGATLTELRVERRADGSWLCQCVVDV